MSKLFSSGEIDTFDALSRLVRALKEDDSVAYTDSRYWPLNMLFPCPTMELDSLFFFLFRRSLADLAMAEAFCGGFCLDSVVAVFHSFLWRVGLHGSCGGGTGFFM